MKCCFIKAFTHSLNANVEYCAKPVTLLFLFRNNLFSNSNKRTNNRSAFSSRPVLPGYLQRKNSEGHKDIEHIFVRCKMIQMTIPAHYK